jgi:hypothetical protein
MEYVVYCDESRHDCPEVNQYMAIGSLWVPREKKAEVTRRFRRLLRNIGIGSEVKWKKVSRARLEAYKQIVDFFFSEQDLNFRVIVVDQRAVDVDRFHNGDRELGFYKFYYELLNKWIDGGNEYLILLDYKQNKGADRYTGLRHQLERRAGSRAAIRDLTVIDSAESPLGQLCDLLTGATAAAWCDDLAGEAKAALVRHISERCHPASLLTETPSPARCKMNIFRIDLSLRT